VGVRDQIKGTKKKGQRDREMWTMGSVLRNRYNTYLGRHNGEREREWERDCKKATWRPI